MDLTHITPGELYAYRPSPCSRDPFQRIEAIERVTTSRGKWKVRFLDDPYPGLEDRSPIRAGLECPRPR